MQPILPRLLNDLCPPLLRQNVESEVGLHIKDLLHPAQMALFTGKFR